LPRTLPKIEEIAIENKYKDFVFYESPNRILQTLEYIQNVRPNAKVAFGRELTKVFEEVKVGEISEIISHLKLNIVKGEFVCIIFREEKTSEDDDIKEKVKVLQNKGFSAKDISVILSELYGMNKNVVYKISIGK
jgi:16S rRNA (cytidine1402-2'-O)-methyltransferase